jgi:hypothetical protein
VLEDEVHGKVGDDPDREEEGVEVAADEEGRGEQDREKDGRERGGRKDEAEEVTLGVLDQSQGERLPFHVGGRVGRGVHVYLDHGVEHVTAVNQVKTQTQN